MDLLVVTNIPHSCKVLVLGKLGTGYTGISTYIHNFSVTLKLF